MIPEAYWKFISQWFWLIGIFAVMGAAGSYFIAQTIVTFESQGVLGITYVQHPDGTISFDEFDRRLEANRLAAEIGGSWVMQSLTNTLAQEGIIFVETLDQKLTITPPSRNRAQVGAAVITIRAHDPDPAKAQRLAELATQIFMENLLERQDRFLRLRQQQANDQILQLEKELINILSLKRQVLQEEAIGVNTATEDLIDAHERMLGQIPLILGEFQREVQTTDPLLAIDTSYVDNAIVLLGSKVSTLSSEWQTSLAPALRTLYAAEAIPEYQLALIRERPVREHLENAFKLWTSLSTSLSTNGDSSNTVIILAKGTTPELVRIFGLRARFILIIGAVLGLTVGWVMSNLGQYLLNLRVQRRNTKSLSLPENDTLATANDS